MIFGKRRLLVNVAIVNSTTAGCLTLSHKRLRWFLLLLNLVQTNAKEFS